MENQAPPNRLLHPDKTLRSPTAVRITIERKHIDVNPQLQMTIGILNKESSIIVDLRVGITVFLVVLETMNRTMFGFELATEPLVIGPWHRDVKIVVPWDEAIVPDGTEQRPLVKRITKPVFHAKSMNLIENSFLDTLQFLCRRDGFHAFGSAKVEPALREEPTNNQKVPTTAAYAGKKPVDDLLSSREPSRKREEHPLNCEAFRDATFAL